MKIENQDVILKDETELLNDGVFLTCMSAEIIFIEKHDTSRVKEDSNLWNRLLKLRKKILYRERGRYSVFDYTCT